MKLKLPYGLMAAALGLSMMAACGPDDDDNNEDNTPLTSDQFMTRASDAIIDAQCKSIFQCPEQLDIAIRVLGRFKDVADCKASFSRLGSLKEDYNDGLEDGRIKYDASLAQACLTKVEAMANASICLSEVFEEEDLEELPECEQLFVGQVADGGSCLNDNECSGDLKCNFESGETCYGVCKADPCDACTDAQYCDELGDTPVCKDRDALGAECTYFQATCVKGASCFFGEADTGKCIADKSIDDDEECDEDAQCKSGLCSEFTCSPPSTPPMLGAAGDECNDFLWCQPGLSCQGLIADTDMGTCKTLATKDEDCDFSEQCEFELQCQGATETTKGKCSERLPDGQDCTYSDDCKSNICDEDTNKCVSDMICSL